MGKDLSKVIAALLKWSAESKIIIRDLSIEKSPFTEDYIFVITLITKKNEKEVCIKRVFLLGRNLEWDEYFNSLELDDAIKSIVEYKAESENHETLSE